MSDKKERNSNEIGALSSIADFLAIIDLLNNQQSYVSEWNIRDNGKVLTTTIPNILGSRIRIKTEVNVYIENLGDRVTIYDIKADFIDKQKQKIVAHELFIHTNGYLINKCIVLEKGDVVSIKLTAILLSRHIDYSIDSLEHLEILFMATGGSKNKTISL